MHFVLNSKNLPFFVSKKDGKKSYYRCKISASAYFVDFSKKAPGTMKFPDNIYTIEEIRQVLGIAFVPAWNEKLGQIVQISNKVVSSIEESAPIEENKG